MTDLLSGWKRLASDPLVLVQTYSFGPANANALAVGLPNGKLLIVSPPAGASKQEMQALATYGEFIALLENNGMHHLGLSAWRAAFPSATPYATPRAAARIRTKGKFAGPIEPIEKLAPLLGDKIQVLPVPGDKVGDVVVRVRSENGELLYVSDLIANMPALPPKLLPRLLFKLTDSAPGLKVFGLFFKFFIADRGAALRFLIEQTEANPPTTLVPAHGEVLTRQDLGSTLLNMLRGAI